MRRAAGIALCLLAGCGLFPELEYLSTCKDGCGGTAGATGGSGAAGIATAGRGGAAGASGEAGKAAGGASAGGSGVGGASGFAGTTSGGSAGSASGAGGNAPAGAAGVSAGQSGAAGKGGGGASGQGGAGVGGTGGSAAGAGASAFGGAAGKAGAAGNTSGGKGGAAGTGTGGASGNGGSSVGGSAGAGGGAVACPSGRGPSMVRLPKNLGGGCIDSTEVTFSQYQQFITASDVDPSDQPPECALNTGLLAFRPTEYIYTAYKANPGGAGGAAGSPGYGDTAVSGVDWCDARAFCAWAGKKLCGKVGGGALPAAQRSTATDQWWLACATQEGKTYPYGGLTIDGTVRNDVYDKSLCTTEVQSAAQIRQRPSKPTCEGGVKGVYDMSGNIMEWTDSCVTGTDGQPQTDLCATRGGSFNFDGSSVKCSFSQSAERVRPEQTSVNDPNGLYYAVYGFRCCSE